MSTRTPRASRGLFAVGIAFLVIGISQGTSFFAIGIAFIAIAIVRRRREQEPPTVPIEDGLIGSAGEAEAIAVAVRFVEAEGASDRFRLETASATESATAWRVSFERTEVVIPPVGVVSVDKRDGTAVWVPMR